MDRRYCCAVLLGALSLAGCQTHPLDDAAWPSARPLGGTLNAYRPPAARKSLTHEDEAPTPAVTGTLSLREAMALTLLHSPDLRAFAYEVRVAEARAVQAGLWENPELEVEFENVAGSGPFAGGDSLETTVSLAQTFPLGGDDKRRREAATLEATLVGWDYEAARLQVLREVTQQYVRVLVAQRRVEAAKDSLALAEQVSDSTQRRVEAGAAASIELVRAKVPLASAQLQMRRAERELRQARLSLAATWGGDEATYGTVVGALDDVQPAPDVSRIVARISQSPDVARWVTEISLRQAELELADAQAMPDVTGRIGVRDDRAEDAQSLVIGISLPLPLFDRGQGDKLAARLGAAGAEQRRQAAERRIGVLLGAPYTELANAYDEVDTIQSLALPQATEAFDVTRRAFDNGDLTLLDLLDAERTLVELREQHLDALQAYHTAAAEIESLIGQSLATLHDTTPTAGEVPTNQPEVTQP